MYGDNYLTHYGKIGMKWGNHKTQVKVDRKKLTNISKKLEKSGDNRADAKLINYAKQPVYKRVTKALISNMSGMLVGDVLTGKTKHYSTMNKKQIIAKTVKLLTTASIDIALKETMSKSVAKKYDDTGKQIKGKTNPLFTKEELLTKGVKTAVALAPIASMVLGTKAKQSNNLKRQADIERENVYKRHGKNIISDKTHSYVNASYTVK